MLPIFILGDEFNLKTLDGYVYEEKPHEKVDGAVVYKLEVGSGDVLLTIFNGFMHEIIYQTPSWFPWTRRKKNAYLFNSYSGGLRWVEFMDNGFGKVYDREDKKLYALTARILDYTTFGTSEWHAEKYR